MFDFQSIVIYFGLALLTFYIAKYAELTDSRRAVWFIVLAFSLIAGLRAASVGIDTKTYHNIFNNISIGQTNKIYAIEIGFIYICKGLLSIWNNNQFLFFLFGFVSYGLCIFRLWKDRYYISFRWAVFVYNVLFFAFSLNGLRQFIAVSIVFFATAFIKEGKYIKFVLAILIASQFHLSAIAGFAYLIFELLFLKYFEVKRKLLVFSFAGIGGLFALSMLSDVLNKYMGFFDDRVQSFGLMMFIKIALLAISIILMEKTQDSEEQYFCFSSRYNYFIGLLLNSLSYFFMYMGRIGIYFYVFEAIYIGYWFKKKNKTVFELLLKCAYVAILLYYIYDSVTSGPNGEIPYRFFWQN